MPLFSVDVESLYTNIETEKGLAAVRSCFRRNPELVRPDKRILRLLELTLTKNNFIYLI